MDGGGEAGLDFVRGAGGVHALEVGAIDRVEDLAHARQEVRALEGGLGRAAASGHAREALRRRELEQQHEIGHRELGLGGGEQPSGVEAARALIGDGREEVAVGEHDGAARQGGRDPLPHVQAALLEEQRQLLLGGHRHVALRELADLPAGRAVVRLARGHDLAAGRGEPLREARQLRGLARAVEPLEHDQSPAVHGRVTRARSRRAPERPQRARQALGSVTVLGGARTRAGWHAGCSTESRRSGVARQPPFDRDRGPRRARAPGRGLGCGVG